jgi:hypothetical protein
MITQEELKQLLDYDPTTGIFTRKVSKGGQKVGSVAGCLDKAKGHLQICINMIQYQAHRLAWLYMTGNWPKQQIDHINGSRSDNRIENLRDVSNRDNQSNRHTHRNGRLVGASWNKQNKKWKANIVINRHKHFLGYFPTEQAAHEAYLTAKQNLV